MATYRKADFADGVQYWAIEQYGEVEYVTSWRVAAAIVAIRNRGL